MPSSAVHIAIYHELALSRDVECAESICRPWTGGNTADPITLAKTASHA